MYYILSYHYGHYIITFLFRHMYKMHQENNMLLDLLEELESARLTRLTRTSFTFL